MTTNAPEHSALRAAITERLNANDLLGVMDHGAPADEYDPEMEDFARLIAGGETIEAKGGRGRNVRRSDNRPSEGTAGAVRLWGSAGTGRNDAQARGAGSAPVRVCTRVDSFELNLRAPPDHKKHNRAQYSQAVRGRFTWPLKKRKILSRRIVLCGKGGAGTRSRSITGPHSGNDDASGLPPVSTLEGASKRFMNHSRPFIGEGR
jgi:hypothetical protein